MARPPSTPRVLFVKLELMSGGAMKMCSEKEIKKAMGNENDGATI